MFLLKFQQFKLRILFVIAICNLTEIGFAQQMFVSSRNSHEVKLYDLAPGDFIKNFVTAGSGRYSFPAECFGTQTDFCS